MESPSLSRKLIKDRGPCYSWTSLKNQYQRRFLNDTGVTIQRVERG